MGRYARVKFEEFTQDIDVRTIAHKLIIPKDKNEKNDIKFSNC